MKASGHTTLGSGAGAAGDCQRNAVAERFLVVLGLERPSSAAVLLGGIRART